ncbi:MAG TPA: DUF3536 domain-containing protein [Longimicrobiales bacterium]|nr:DUF3536 domain-containing protein [Longimicrobiales bacterium]
MKYICIHGHFYQPPRENPWLEAVERQESAYPYHDWNERITAESYATNATARILDGQGRIARIVNNYSRISFNFGPTLLAWMEAKAPAAYEGVIRADRRSAERFGGHGSALAQAYNHMIMPLANERDRRTQVFWGARDFVRRFGRKPEGMWLPETAVDVPTLEALAAHGITFTILAPHQAARVRPLVGGEPVGGLGWTEVTGARIDPTRPYLQNLPSGRSIVLFFYDGPISRAVAFERLLASGERFAGRITHAFRADDGNPQLAHIATDGETYGHHHPNGDMALAWALAHIEESGLGRLTNYAQCLELDPPRHEVEILEDTSWSCAHGLERWRSDCGCNSGGRPGWSQLWRQPLREALDFLRDELVPLYESGVADLVNDPWVARDEYIDVVMDRARATRFLERNASHELSQPERTRLWKLLELQRHAMLMYTSCGWFFDELSGIETTQVVQYAGRAVELAEDLFGAGIEARFLERLEQVPSNLPAVANGRRLYEQFVVPARVDLAKVAAHYAVSSLFERYPDNARVYAYRVDSRDRRWGEAGRTRLAVGHLDVTSTITEETAHFSYGALRLADHTVSGGVSEFAGEEAYANIADELTSTFRQADFATAMRLMDRYFHASIYSLRTLFHDQQQKVLEKAMEKSLAQAEASYRQIYERNAPLMRFLRGLSLPQPPEFRAAADLVLNADVRREAASDDLDPDRMLSLLGEANESDVMLDRKGIGYAMTQTLERAMARLVEDPDDIDRLERVDRLASLMKSAPFEINLWTVQNLYWDLMHSVLPDKREDALEHEAARDWVGRFEGLGHTLNIVVPAWRVPVRPNGRVPDVAPPDDGAPPPPEDSATAPAEPGASA